MKIAVVVGGIGGIVFAYLSQKMGHEVVVLEKYDRARSYSGGTAFMLWPNGVKLLNSIGRSEAISVSAPMERKRNLSLKSVENRRKEEINLFIIMCFR